MPQIVNQVAAVEDSRGKPIQLKSWAVAPELFPCQLSPDTLSQAKEVKHTLRCLFDCSDKPERKPCHQLVTPFTCSCALPQPPARAGALIDSIGCVIGCRTVRMAVLVFA